MKHHIPRSSQPFNGHKIRICRERAGLSQRRFAEALGVAPSNVCGWERQRKPIPIKYNAQICALLAVDADALLLLPEDASANKLEDCLSATPRLQLIHANWHLLPLNKQRAIIDIVTQHLTEMAENTQLL